MRALQRPGHEMKRTVPLRAVSLVAPAARLLWRLRLVLLIAVSAVGAWYSATLPGSFDLKGLTADRRDARGSAMTFFEDVTPQDVTRIHIKTASGEDIYLRRGAEFWEIRVGADWFAIPDERAALLFEGAEGQRELQRSMAGSPLHAEQVVLERLFTSWPGAGAIVEFGNGASVLEALELGRPAERYGRAATFVRRPGYPGAAVVSADLHDNFAGRTAIDWLDLGLTPLNAAEVTRLEVAGLPSGGWALERDGDGWNLIDGSGRKLGSANAARAEQAVRSVARMQAVDVRSGSSNLAADGDSIRFTLHATSLAEPVTVLVSVAETDDSGVLAAASSHRPGDLRVVAPAAALRPVEEYLAPAAAVDLSLRTTR